ncbi:MAG TPA: sigma-70 family RNA polymerase sigma factor [Cyclobacteriaceae bacterium]|nr:sigma-70 family RNA polymerase sigma factor [Cyclobacteriaceae bacterium]
MEITTSQKEFTGYIRENRGIIFKICRSYCADQDDREDLAQEIVYNLWKSFGTYDTALRFSTWMYRVALNVAISFYRRERKHKDHDEFSERLIVYEDDWEKESNLKLLQGFIQELKEIDKAIILLYLEDKGHREIAEITGFTETNVSTRISRIKETLRVKFQNL